MNIFSASYIYKLLMRSKRNNIISTLHELFRGISNSTFSNSFIIFELYQNQRDGSISLRFVHYSNVKIEDYIGYDFRPSKNDYILSLEEEKEFDYITFQELNPVLQKAIESIEITKDFEISYHFDDFHLFIKKYIHKLLISCSGFYKGNYTILVSNEKNYKISMPFYTILKSTTFSYRLMSPNGIVNIPDYTVQLIPD